MSKGSGRILTKKKDKVKAGRQKTKRVQIEIPVKLLSPGHISFSQYMGAGKIKGCEIDIFYNSSYIGVNLSKVNGQHVQAQIPMDKILSAVAKELWEFATPQKVKP